MTSDHSERGNSTQPNAPAPESTSSDHGDLQRLQEPITIADVAQFILNQGLLIDVCIDDWAAGSDWAIDGQVAIASLDTYRQFPDSTERLALDHDPECRPRERIRPSWSTRPRTRTHPQRKWR
ncbi:MAG: hypothetical protein J2P23_04565 [Microlunatus sp.]|nr:hypothetical protein [Microlunatus sp.]